MTARVGLKNHIVEPNDKQILHAVVDDIEQVRPRMAGQVAVVRTIYRDRAPVGAILGARSLSENPIWLRAACFTTGLCPAASTIYTDIACFAVLASRKTARSRANDGILRHTPGLPHGIFPKITLKVEWATRLPML